MPRLFVDLPLGPDRHVALSKGQQHYVARVMRLGQGDGVRLFNGGDGEWLADLDGDEALCREQHKVQPAAGGPWLLFAPPKRDRLRFLVEKATELGAARLIPVTTERTESLAAKAGKMHEWAVEAAEQCGRCDVPDCLEQRGLDSVLADWTGDRRLLLCDETSGGAPLGAVDYGPCTFLVGPEGGFAPGELEALRAKPEVVPVSLGSHILRVETACLAALATWHLRSSRASVSNQPGGAPTS